VPNPKPLLGYFEKKTLGGRGGGPKKKGEGGGGGGSAILVLLLAPHLHKTMHGFDDLLLFRLVCSM